MAFRERVLHRSERMLERACRRLPVGVRDERYREWAAELPAILDDPGTRWPLRRAARTLLFAADQRRSVARLRPREVAANHPTPARKLRPRAVRGSRDDVVMAVAAAAIAAAIAAAAIVVAAADGAVVVAAIAGAAGGLVWTLASRNSRGRNGSARGSDGEAR